MTTILIVLGLLFLKHFIADFLLQFPRHYLNKGTYGHIGGIEHAAIHGVGTVLCLLPWTPLAVGIGILDVILHYHIDWAKIRLNTHYKLTAVNSEEFWWLLGLDQFLHSLTYLLFVGMIFK